MTKYELRITGECKQNLKICKKRGLPMQELWDVVAKLLRGEKLDEKYQAHQLRGNRKGQWGEPHPAQLAPCLGAERNRTHSYIGKYWNSFRPFRKEQTITNHRPTI